MFGMNKPNMVEIVFGYIYGNSVQPSINVKVGKRISDEKMYRVPFNTPAYSEESIECLYAYPSREEVIAMFNGSEFKGSIKIDVKNCNQELDATLFDSPQSITVKLSPDVKFKKSVTIHPYEVVQQRQFGNGSSNRSILKKN